MAILRKTFTVYRCERCGHEWIPRGDRPPDVCPSPTCKSPYWDRPRRQQPAAARGKRKR
jgi:rubrerythrin